MKIPDWNNQAVIPPVRDDVPPERQSEIEYRSPYLTTINDVIDRFATTSSRVQLLHGLLDYRRALYDAGITQGFQWLDGSFVENVEARPRPGKEPRPYDIDVVTFYHPPADGRPEPPELFKLTSTREQYSIDSYGVPLGEPLDQELVEAISYWHGMWSLRRQDQQPKGFSKSTLTLNTTPSPGRR